jgi:dTDP-4-dehydrorhamnose reductase
MDITDRNEVGKYLTSNFDPANKLIIIHCAAATDTKNCEEEPDDCYRTNSIGTFNLAEYVYGMWKFNFDIKLVYISTDHVFDGERDFAYYFGTAHANYDEDDIPNPQGHYAKSKLIGEWFTLANPNNLVIRTSFMKDFKLKKAFTDKYWSGLWVEEVAKLIAKAVKMDLKGLYHIAGERKSIYDFVKTKYPKVKPISLKDNPIGRSGLPYLKDTSLDTTKWKNALKTRRKKHKSG